jgi:hypothetical protein
MALGTTTLTVTVNSVAKVLTRIADDGYTSEYLLRGTLDEYRLKIRHSNYTDSKRGGRSVDRHNVELQHTVYPVSPSTISTIRKAYIVLENDSTDGLTDPLNFDNGFIAFLTSGNVTDLINWVS